MKEYPFPILIATIIIAIGMTPAIGNSVCDEPIPELFQRVSSSVVSISALGRNAFKVSGRFSTAEGSGFIIDGKGLVLTNSHVVFDRFGTQPYPSGFSHAHPSTHSD